MADRTRGRTPRSNGASMGNMIYLNRFYEGNVAAVPAPRYAPPQRQTWPVPETAPQTEPQVKPRVHERSRVRVQVREQQPVAPLAIIGFFAVAAIAVVLLLGYNRLNSVYAETSQLRTQLSELQSEASNLEARYAEVFDMDTLERAVAANGSLSKPTSTQSVYIDLSEPDNAVVYGAGENATGISGFFQSVGSLISSAVEFFR